MSENPVNSEGNDSEVAEGSVNAFVADLGCNGGVGKFMEDFSRTVFMIVFWVSLKFLI